MNDDMTTLQPGDSTTSLSRRRALGHLGMGALVVGALAGPGMGTGAAQATPAAGSIEAVARQAIDAVFDPDVAGHPPHRSLVTSEPLSHDLAGLKAGLADMRHFFPDAAITIDDLITTDGTVAARVTFRGTPDAAALGLGEEASQPLEIGGLMYGRIVDGRIKEFWVYFDLSAYIDLVESLPPAVMATPTGSS